MRAGVCLGLTDDNGWKLVQITTGDNDVVIARLEGPLPVPDAADH